MLGTLAAAYAEAGRFPDAIRIGEQAERLATAASDKARASVSSPAWNYFATASRIANCWGNEAASLRSQPAGFSAYDSR